MESMLNVIKAGDRKDQGDGDPEFLYVSEGDPGFTCVAGCDLGFKRAAGAI